MRSDGHAPKRRLPSILVRDRPINTVRATKRSAARTKSRAVSPGGGKFVTITPKNGAPPISVNVTHKVFNAVESLKISGAWKY